jgi:hypothetical protein
MASTISGYVTNIDVRQTRQDFQSMGGKTRTIAAGPIQLIITMVVDDSVLDPGIDLMGYAELTFNALRSVTDGQVHAEVGMLALIEDERSRSW